MLGLGIDLFRYGGGGTPFEATGGTITEITDGGVTYKVHTFTTSGTFEVVSGEAEVEYLVIAGGWWWRSQRRWWRRRWRLSIWGWIICYLWLLFVNCWGWRFLWEVNGSSSTFGAISSVGGGRGGSGSGNGVNGGSGGGVAGYGDLVQQEPLVRVYADKETTAGLGCQIAIMRLVVAAAVQVALVVMRCHLWAEAAALAWLQVSAGRQFSELAVVVAALAVALTVAAVELVVGSGSKTTATTGSSAQ